MADILSMIAGAQAPVDPVTSFQNSRKNALASSLMQAQLEAAKAGTTAAQAATQNRTDLANTLGTKQFPDAFKRYAVTNPKEAATIQQNFENLSDDQLQKTFALISMSKGLPPDKQNAVLKLAQANIAGSNPVAGQAINSFLTAQPEQKAQLYNNMEILGQQMGVLESLPTASKTSDQIERELALKESELALKEKVSGPEGQPKVGAQEILEDGTIIQSTSKGPRVYDSEGNVVKGKAAREAILKARAKKVDNLRLAAGAKKRAALEVEEELKPAVEAGILGAKEAQKISVAAFDRLEKINTAIGNLNEAIELIDQGAQTGAIMSKLPSVRAASVKLDNLQGRLGLDVIGNTTFGALSEAELKFALDTALPQKLKGQQLKNWLIRKRDSQEKLSDYVESGAIFLGVPGNTVSDWIQKQRSRDEQTEAQTQETQPTEPKEPEQKPQIKFLGFE